MLQDKLEQLAPQVLQVQLERQVHQQVDAANAEPGVQVSERCDVNNNNNNNNNSNARTIFMVLSSCLKQLCESSPWFTR